jgi:Polysulphide reductase, NrfD
VEVSDEDETRVATPARDVARGSGAPLALDAAATEIARRERSDGRDATRGGAAAGYYGRPILKPPVWTWEIPVYFFTGGIAGTSAIIALAAVLQEKQPLAPQPFLHAAAWMACAGAVASACLLIRDLGRPHRFLNMLRVFKWRSPMSVGAWVLAVFGLLATVLAVHVYWPQKSLLYTGIPFSYARSLQVGLAAASAALGSVLATYTGVLIGATVIPAWHSHRFLLPLHFGIAGLGSAAALLELFGFETPALHAIGLGVAATETCVGAWVELHRHGAADRALRNGHAAWLLRGAGALAGPVALGLRVYGARPLAAASFLLGALVSRFGWVEVGRASAKDPGAALGS